MTRSRSLTTLALLALALALPVARARAEPSIARPGLPGAAEPASGVVFFAKVDHVAGAAAVGTAHTIDLRDVADAGLVQFRLGHAGTLVGASARFLVPPGIPFNFPKGSVRDDFVVYGLDSAPEGVDILTLEANQDLAEGDRVRILGIPHEGAADQEDVGGRVAEVARRHVLIDLDVPFDLRGWGGAPVLSARTGRVVAMVQANAPGGSLPRVTAAPISGVRTALSKREAQDAGRYFAQFEAELKALPERAAAPSPKPSARSGRREKLGRHTKPGPMPGLGPILKQPEPGSTNVLVDIEYPPDGAVLSDTTCGTFVAGRAIAHQGELKSFDIALVLDTSRSTVESTGADINGNGLVGQPRMGRIGSIFGTGSTDPGDSILAAEVAAARQLLHGLDPRTTRVAVITFAGDANGVGGPLGRKPTPPAVTLEPLTNDFSRIEQALDFILRTDPAGNTHMAAGVDQGWIELTGMRGSQSKKDPNSEKLMFFFTDGQPTLPFGPGAEADNTRAVLRAASRANRLGIRIHSFAIGPEALAGPIATVEIAALTNGYFTPVRHPGDLVDVVDEVSFANLDQVTVKSLTTGDVAKPFRITADGSWGGFVKLKPGANEIEVVARSTDGAEGTRTLGVVFEPEVPPAVIPRDLTTRRNRLLEDCLRDLKRVRIAAEEAQAEEVRKQLQLEIEQERAKARQRAAEQRKQLRIEAEEFDDEESGTSEP